MYTELPMVTGFGGGVAACGWGTTTGTYDAMTTPGRFAVVGSLGVGDPEPPGLG